MAKISDIELAVREMSPEELAAFRKWFADFDATIWDRQIEDDITSGRLEALADEALQDLREGRAKTI